MTQKFLIAMVGASALVSGCATKGYVRQNVTPVQEKLNQVSDQVNKVGTDLQKTQQDVSKNTQAISATDEKATAADRRAGDAMNRANQANDQGQKDDQEISQLRGVIANLDDYKVSNQATVLFKFNSADLSKEDKAWIRENVARTYDVVERFENGITPEQIIDEQSHFLIKPCQQGGSHGVLAGEAVAQRAQRSLDEHVAAVAGHLVRCVNVGETCEATAGGEVSVGGVDDELHGRQLGGRGVPMRASSEAMTMSAHSAVSLPPPRHQPWTWAMTGFGERHRAM